MAPGQVAGPYDGAQHGGTRHNIKDQADDLNDASPGSTLGEYPSSAVPFTASGEPISFICIHPKERSTYTAQHSACYHCPSGLLRHVLPPFKLLHLFRLGSTRKSSVGLKKTWHAESRE